MRRDEELAVTVDAIPDQRNELVRPHRIVMRAKVLRAPIFFRNTICKITGVALNIYFFGRDAGGTRLFSR